MCPGSGLGSLFSCEASCASFRQNAIQGKVLPGRSLLYSPGPFFSFLMTLSMRSSSQTEALGTVPHVGPASRGMRRQEEIQHHHRSIQQQNHRSPLSALPKSPTNSAMPAFVCCSSMTGDELASGLTIGDLVERPFCFSQPFFCL
uniref:Uncharacterized protein n=1 Tax=Aegilops tauschii subsp. strangulata TaxID=200361 RepID=A0A452XVS2_AEGTS